MNDTITQIQNILVEEFFEAYPKARKSGPMYNFIYQVSYRLVEKIQKGEIKNVNFINEKK